jgi:hypothetical protein
VQDFIYIFVVVPGAVERQRSEVRREAVRLRLQQALGFWVWFF